MKTIKINHFLSEDFEQTINNCENNGVLFVVWPHTMCVVVQYQPWQGEDLFSHLVTGYNPTCDLQFVTQEDKEALFMKSYTVLENVM